VIQILLYANVLAFKGRVRDGGERGVSGTKPPDLKVQPYPIVYFPYLSYINIAN
jgi:hypothetical protein